MPAIERDDRQDRERIRAVDLAVGQIEKQFGKGSIMRLGQKGAIQPIDAIPTGAISIDFALGVGGVPRGRVVEIFGPESSGKTTLALQVIAEAQKLGGLAAFVDAEHALDAAYAQKLGVDLDNLLVSQPDNGEQALEIVEVLIRSNGGDVVVGGRTRVKVVKNKVAPPFREAEFDVMYGEGISRTGDLLDLAVDKRIVEKSGAWFAYGGERLGQGRENAKQFLKENPDVYKAIEERVRRELGMLREAEAATV